MEWRSDEEEVLNLPQFTAPALASRCRVSLADRNPEPTQAKNSEQERKSIG